MQNESASSDAFWSSRLAFLMAAVGSSVGLGNLWRFSAQAGDNGGGAFILVYALCIVGVGIPVLISEYIIGRSGQGASAVNSVRDLAARSGGSANWSALAWMGTFSAFLIVSFYCVVAAWVMMYIPKFLSGSFEGRSAAEIAALFEQTQANGSAVLAYVAVFLALTVAFVSRGVNRGIELASKTLMPLFFFLLLALAAYSLWTGAQHSVSLADGSNGTGASRAVEFMFDSDFSKINSSVIVSALGQAFFSIGLGTATMITYGSYLPASINIPRSAFVIGLTDTAVALIAGLAIFPIVFAYGLDSSGGAGLFFKTLPVALTAIPGGFLVGAGFFLLALFAALTTAIALFEVITAFILDRIDTTRSRAAISLGVATFVVAIGSVYSSNFMTVLDEKITGAIMVPLCGLLVVLFVGWGIDKKILDAQLATTAVAARLVLLFFVRYIAPAFVAMVLAAQIVDAFFA